MTDKRERIIDIIRKLHAKAESCQEIGSEAEAQTFASAVQRLLTAYKLSMGDVSRSTERENIDRDYITWELIGLKSRNVRTGWTERLAHLVGQAYYCYFIVATGSGRIGLFVGRKSDRQVAVFMFVTLARFLNNLADKEHRHYTYKAWKEGGRSSTGAIPDHAHGFRASFVRGFIDRLRERFDEEIRPKHEANINTQAIMLMRQDALDQARAWAKENLALVSCRPSDRNSFVTSDAGYLEGRKAASDVNLDPHPVTGTTGPVRTLYR